MSPKPDGGSAKKPTNKSTNNLVAIGSIAVLGVYAAGYARTAAAADRFAKAAERHPAAVIARADSPAPPHAEPAMRGATVAAPGSTAAPTPATPGATQPQAEPTSAPSVGATVAPAASTSATPKSAAALAKAPATNEPAKDSVVATKPATVVAAAPPAPARTEPAPVKAAPPAVDSAAVAREAEKQRVTWKDGAYVGYGTSRHGDIEATIEIKAGKIISASISDCRTQYSCSWISALPPQVVTRQSPEVDYVSGATQSSNAFYAAIVDALSKAK